jgi:uncharacterized protein YceK
MKRHIAIALIAVLALAGCASIGGRSAADQAEVTYGQAAITYSTAQSAIVDLRAQHLISDVQWAEFDRAQHAVAATAPVVSRLLRDWEAGGVKPADYDQRFLQLLEAFTTVTNIYNKVKP